MTDPLQGSERRQPREKVPLPFILAAGGLVALTLVLIGTARMTGFGESMVPDQEVVAMRELRFEDRSSGAIAVYAEPDSRLIAEVEPRAGGFIRGTLRALVRERRQHGVGDNIPFRLSRAADGSLMLGDPATGRRIVLGAFGPTNEAVFASLLTSGSKQP
jgi:putative photosynthetic complex assembly protein